ncbi:HlyD family secretion protein [Vibrio sp. FNV 38]|nr:HlyD family secretion protein [Vibrio sp. FNV 38]
MSKAENSSRKLSLIIISIILIVWLYSLWADRVTPMTGIARVHSYIVQIAPEVSGNITTVQTKDNQVVDANDVLFEIDDRNYQISLRSAEANLALVGQNIGASTAAVNVAQAKVTEARAARDNTREQANRVSDLASKGLVSRSDLDNAIENRDVAQASLKAAEASLVQAKQALGPEGDDNPQVLAAIATLEQAQLNLQKTKVVAPSHGVVSNLQLTVGQRATAGSSVLTFVDPREVWISAFYRENSLEHIQIGQTVEIVLDALPGRVVYGKVESIGWGTGGSNTIDQQTGFLTPDTSSMSAQRYPVNIVFDQGEIPDNIRFGSQATVAVMTEQSSVGEWLAHLWMRILSVWTYVS